MDQDPTSKAGDGQRTEAVRPAPQQPTQTDAGSASDAIATQGADGVESRAQPVGNTSSQSPEIDPAAAGAVAEAAGGGDVAATAEEVPPSDPEADGVEASPGESSSGRWSVAKAEVAQAMEGLGSRIGASRRAVRKFADRVSSRIGERLELATVPSKSKLKAGADYLQSLGRRLPKVDVETLRSQAGALVERVAIRERAAAIGGRFGLGRKAGDAEPAGPVRVKPARRKAGDTAEVAKAPRRRTAKAAPAEAAADGGAVAKAPRKRAAAGAASDGASASRSRAAKARGTTTQAGSGEAETGSEGKATRSRRKVEPASASGPDSPDSPDTTPPI